MPHNVLMPALSPTMTEGKLAKWLKKEGDEIKAGTVIAEIETDKATMEVEAVEEGTLAKILVPAGTEGVAVNTLIAVLLEEGEDASALKNIGAGGAPKTVTPANQPSAEPSKPAPSMAVAQKAAPAPVSATGGRIFASPLAKRIAKERGIDLSTVKGSGPHGRIVVTDLDKAKAGAAPVAGAPATRAPVAPSGPGAQALADAYGIPYSLVPNSGVRKVIARRLGEAKQTVPHFYLSVDIDLDALLKLRKELNDSAEGFKISVNDFVIKATAVALEKYPAANVSWTDENIVQYERADVSVAVATENGLITPIIKDAANKSLKVISNEMKVLAAKARDGKLKPEEFQGGTISVSNLGMFGIREFAAIVNPPQGAILAVGAGEQRAVVKDGHLAVATQMTVTMSTDHRCIDGAVGAEYLQVFKKLLESPMSLIL
ncbi:MAG: pyruvate dehydrogenase complex dihydrolipoamide acetyltransferase [Alphaproteobacteria bacterium]|nr:pyruvate dehydrogenase complex dihydrolipoamide acetyltransferase [Alphaproteobacteria bacterium]